MLVVQMEPEVGMPGNSFCQIHTLDLGAAKFIP